MSKIRRPDESGIKFRRAAVVVSAVALAFTASAWADAVGGHAARSVSQHVGLTQVLFQSSATGAPPMSGSNSAVGTSDGRIGNTTVHGAVRGTNTYPGFIGKWTMFDPSGAIGFSLKGHVVASGQFAGTATITGGTGKYKNAHGVLTFTARSRSAMDGESSPVIVRNITGTLSLP